MGKSKKTILRALGIIVLAGAVFQGEESRWGAGQLDVLRSFDRAGMDEAAAVEVHRVPELRQATAPGAFHDTPPFDGSSAGHHFQLALAQDLTGVPANGALPLSILEQQVARWLAERGADPGSKGRG